jgi:hypothetical protein
MNTLHECFNDEQPDKVWLINLWDAETSDAWGEDRSTTCEDSCMFGTGLWIYLQDDGGDELSLRHNVLRNSFINQYNTLFDSFEP